MGEKFEFRRKKLVYHKAIPKQNIYGFTIFRHGLEKVLERLFYL